MHKTFKNKDKQINYDSFKLRVKKSICCIKLKKLLAYNQANSNLNEFAFELKTQKV